MKRMPDYSDEELDGLAANNFITSESEDMDNDEDMGINSFESDDYAGDSEDDEEDDNGDD